MLTMFAGVGAWFVLATAAGAVVLTWLSAAASPCICPVPFGNWMRGEWCPKHEEQSELTR